MSESLPEKKKLARKNWVKPLFLTAVLGITGVSAVGIIFAREKFFRWMQSKFPI